MDSTLRQSVRAEWLKASSELTRADGRAAESWRYDLAAAAQIMEAQAAKIEELIKAELGAVLVAMDATGVSAEAVRATAVSRVEAYLGRSPAELVAGAKASGGGSK